MLRAFVVRHAQSLANLDSRLSSALPGPPLTELGHRQSRDAAERLAAAGVTHVYTSPLLRTRTTAGHIADRLGVEVSVLDELREFDLGDWEGRPGTDRDILDHPVFAAWLRGRDRDESFQGGETASDLRSRLAAGLDHVVANHDAGSVVLVSHGGLMAVAVPPLVADAPALARIPANAEIWELVHDGTSWHGAADGGPAPWPSTFPVAGG